MEKVVNILMIEDDTVDVMDAQRTLSRIGLLYKIKVCKNGEEALAYLSTVEQDARPDIVLLDLNMPKMNGAEFLYVLRGIERWKDLKVFVITTSAEKEEKDKMNELGISGYIVKPLKFNNPSSIDSFNLMIDLMNIKNRI